MAVIDFLAITGISWLAGFSCRYLIAFCLIASDTEEAFMLAVATGSACWSSLAASLAKNASLSAFCPRVSVNISIKPPVPPIAFTSSPYCFCNCALAAFSTSTISIGASSSNRLAFWRLSSSLTTNSAIATNAAPILAGLRLFSLMNKAICATTGSTPPNKSLCLISSSIGIPLSLAFFSISVALTIASTDC